MAKTHRDAPYEEGFFLLLLLLAIAGLGYVMWPFIPALVLAVVVATAGYPLYELLQRRLGSKERAAALTTGAIALFIMAPILYILVAAGFRAGQLYQNLKAGWSGGVDVERILQVLPLPQAWLVEIEQQLRANLPALVDYLQQLLLHLFGVLINNSLSILLSSVIVLLALFFLFRDGPTIARRLKDLSPLANQYDTLLMDRFRMGASILTVSTLVMALLQGATLAAVTLFMGLPWFFIGVSTAIASFIPAVGAFLVWGPLALYTYASGHPIQALIIAFTGAVVMGFVIDNLLRPQIITGLSRVYSAQGGGTGILDHSLLVFLTILGGVMSFGILGLIYGPLIGAMALSVIDVYEIKHGDRLDRT